MSYPKLLILVIFAMSTACSNSSNPSITAHRIILDDPINDFVERNNFKLVSAQHIGEPSNNRNQIYGLYKIRAPKNADLQLKFTEFIESFTSENQFDTKIRLGTHGIVENIVNRKGQPKTFYQGFRYKTKNDEDARFYYFQIPNESNTELTCVLFMVEDR